MRRQVHMYKVHLEAGDGLVQGWKCGVREGSRPTLSLQNDGP